MGIEPISEDWEVFDAKSCPSPGVGFYGYPRAAVYSYPYSYDNSAPLPADNNNDYNENKNNYSSPNIDSNAPAGQNISPEANAANLTVPVLIYLKSGAVYTVRDYWMIDGELHYHLMGGVRKSVDLDQVDLPRTNTENAKSGVKFIFKSKPGITPAAPDGNAMPPGPSEPSPAPAPTR